VSGCCCHLAVTPAISASTTASYFSESQVLLIMQGQLTAHRFPVRSYAGSLDRSLSSGDGRPRWGLVRMTNTIVALLSLNKNIATWQCQSQSKTEGLPRRQRSQNHCSGPCGHWAVEPCTRTQDHRKTQKKWPCVTQDRTNAPDIFIHVQFLHTIRTCCNTVSSSSDCTGLVCTHSQPIEARARST
jgi:hypothetical protein